MKKEKIKIFSNFSIVSITVFLLVLTIYLVSTQTYQGADFVNEGLSHLVRGLLADATGIFDFSIFLTRVEMCKSSISVPLT